MRASNTKYVIVLGLLSVLVGALAVGLGNRNDSRPESGSERATNGARQSREPAVLSHPADLSGDGAPRVIPEAPVRTANRSPPDDAPEATPSEPEETPAFAVLVRNSDAVSSKLKSDGFFSLKFPLLQPTEARDREFFVFGASQGAEPSLLMVHVHTAQDGSDLPILLAANLWERFEQIVVTVPERPDEEARVVASISRTGRGDTLGCPDDATEPCTVVSYTDVNADGFLARRHEFLAPGESISIRREDLGLVSLLNAAGFESVDSLSKD